MKKFLARLLHVHSSDLGRGSLLFLYLLLIIASYVTGKAVRDALFLDQFKAIQLPWADIAIAILVGFVVAGYVRIGRGLSLAALLAGSLVFFSLNSVLFWWMAHFHDWKATYPIIYVWVGIFGVLAPAQVWTLANFVLTTREAKRMFGMIGGGAIAGWIFGGFLTKFMAVRYGAESLLLAMAVIFVLCAGLVVFIWRRREQSFAEAEDEERMRGASDAEQSMMRSLRMVWSSSYLRSIAAVICLSSFVTTTAGWQFKAIAKIFIPGKNELAAFFGDFNFYAAILALSFQLLFTSRVLKRFGIGPALFVVPVALLFGSAGVLAWFSLTAAIILKGSDQLLRYSIDKSTVELLYLPVPSNIKIQVKSFIDTVIWRMGDGLAGVTILLAASPLVLESHPANAAWVNIGLIVFWLMSAWVARRQYVSTLKDSIQRHRLDSERAAAPVLDRSTLEIFAQNIIPSDPHAILYALSLFEVSGRGASHPAVRELLNHPSPEVRQRTLSLLSAAGDKYVLPRVEQLLHDPRLEVRTEALLYLTHHAHVDPLVLIEELGDFPDFSIRSAMVAFLARPGETQNLAAARTLLDSMARESGPGAARTRLEAARLLSVLPDVFDEQARLLVSDDDWEVARAAIRSVGAHGKRRLVFRVLDRLGEPELVAACADALAMFGDRIVGLLRDHLSDSSVPLAVRREIPDVLVRIGSLAAQRALLENLLESDAGLRFRVLSALNKMRRDHPELTMDTQMIETVLAAEIMGHYRSYQILGTLGAAIESEEPMVKALRDSMSQEVERIFRLLGLLYPLLDLHSAYFGLQSKNQVVHANSLEFIDNILKPQLRAMLVPLLDSDVSVEDRIALANRMVGVKVESREDAVVALVQSDDPWLKSCGAYAIGTLGLKGLEFALDECLKHGDPLLRETARQAKIRLASLATA
jgi:AAA family ATP:ADP antiporter